MDIHRRNSLSLLIILLACGGWAGLAGAWDALWWAGAAGGASRDIADSDEERSFNSSSFSVFLAKQKSDTLLC